MTRAPKPTRNSILRLILHINLACDIAGQMEPYQASQNSKIGTPGEGLDPSVRKRGQPALKQTKASVPLGVERRITGQVCTSPFPQITTFICKLAAGEPGGAAKEAFVRTWSAVVLTLETKRMIQGADDSTDESVQSIDVYKHITYEIGGSRWCNRIGRSHKSNHVAWTVNFEAGTAWQTCWDTECRAAGYRSRSVAVPVDIMPEQVPLGYAVVHPTL
jgi:hypothetical protein